MARTNKYSSDCAKCSAVVPAEAGLLTGPPWRVFCRSCAGPTAAAPSKPTVRLSLLAPASVRVEPVGHLGPAWDKYKAITDSAGARFDVARKCQVLASIESTGILQERLAGAGFVVQVHSDLAAALQAAAERVKADVSGADSRLLAVEARLAERGLSLFRFQRDGVRWLASRSRALLADQMGTGKTIQSLAALPEGAAVVVVCPATLKLNWRAEAARFRPDLRVDVLSGRGSFRWPGAGEIVVLNPAILPSAAGVAPVGIVLIADEAHAYRTKTTTQTKRFRALAEAATKAGGRVWLLTGTPLLNHGGELLEVLRSGGLLEEAFGSWKRGALALGGYRGRFGFEWDGPRRPVEISAAMARVSLGRRRADVLPDLPTKTRRIMTVELSKSDARALDKIEKEIVKATGAASLEAAVEAALSSKGGVAFEKLSEARRILATAKLPAALDLAEQSEDEGEPLVVFSCHRGPIEGLAVREGWREISGSTPTIDRQDAVEKFQAGAIKGLACVVQAAGVGLTLTRSAHAVFIDRWWNNALNEQAEDRLVRIGQTRGVVITILVAAHAVDEAVMAICSRKDEIVSDVQESVPTEPVANPEEIAAELAKVAEAAREAADLLGSEAPVEDLGAALRRLVAEAEAKDEEAAEEAALRRLEAVCARRLGDGDGEGSGNGTMIARRGAGSDEERWAYAGLQLLAAADPDRAKDLNGIGFSKSDGALGHALAIRARNGGLSERAWRLAVGLCRHYRRQVGE